MSEYRLSRWLLSRFALEISPKDSSRFNRSDVLTSGYLRFPGRDIRPLRDPTRQPDIAFADDDHTVPDGRGRCPPAGSAETFSAASETPFWITP